MNAAQDDHLVQYAIDHIREVAERDFTRLLLARFLLLSLLVEEAQRLPKGLHQEHHRRLWVFLQVQPTIFGQDPKQDIFRDLTKELHGASIDDMRAWIQDERQKLGNLILEPVHNPNTSRNEIPSFFCVLDEAQVTVSQDSKHSHGFISSDNQTSRPVLREIWRSWTKVLEPRYMRVVVSGTGISQGALHVTLASSAFKMKDYGTVHDIGAFDDHETQAKYIKKYLPACFNEPRWVEFLNRSWAWAHGR